MVVEEKSITRFCSPSKGECCIRARLRLKLSWSFLNTLAGCWRWEKRSSKRETQQAFFFFRLQMCVRRFRQNSRADVCEIFTRERLHPSRSPLSAFWHRVETKRAAVHWPASAAGFRQWTMERWFFYLRLALKWTDVSPGRYLPVLRLSALVLPIWTNNRSVSSVRSKVYRELCQWIIHNLHE